MARDSFLQRVLDKSMRSHALAVRLRRLKKPGSCCAGNAAFLHYRQALGRDLEGEDKEMDSSKQLDLQWSLQLLAEVWPAATALAVSVCCATLFFPFFTFCPSSGWLKSLLPQASPSSIASRAAIAIPQGHPDG